jgi:class 3 adenylate cyclase/tetratricopeptide (TPR) repeat protein
MSCPACGTDNAAGAKFCVECGNRLNAGCPSCGTLNVAGAKFCVECGTNLLSSAPSTPAIADGDQAAPASAIPAGSERRLVSVLFADLVGSTTLAEDRDPEESRELLSKYFDVASELIGNYGGTIEKFIGDAVMAVWGVPVAHEDDAERAVRAALDLVSAVAGITDASSGQPLQARAAVLTGEAAATLGAQGQGMVAGDLVNTASRLQGAAPPGSVLVGESTYRATSGAIGYEEAGEQVLKGKTAPVAAWRATQVVGLRGGGGRRAALEPPFVGRDDELRLLKDLFLATARERKPRLVTVVGQAGIGKSRLGWEFEKYIDGVTIDAYWHSGRSPSYGEGISFWALAEMVRERAGIAETEDPESAREKLAAMAAEWLPDAEERRWVEPRLAGLLGLEEMPAGQREELFAAWRTFFERMADRDPVILVFKDLHWADAALLEFIESVLTWSRDHPIYVLAMTRPDLFERHPSWGGATVRNATTVTLEPLGPAPMRELLHGLVPGLPEDAVSTIVERAEGVPLYAVETVRMLIDRGQVVASGDGYALAGPMPKLAVPETLQALVAARIDANDPADRSTLADAAVLGQSFTLAGLSGVMGAEPATVETSLDRLVKREMLIRDDDPRSPERGQYRFVQAIIREIAYETLAKKDRRMKHLAAARYFEGLGDEELAGVQATHYLEAYRSTPPGPEADALAAQARVALRAAGERAAALHSPAAAVRHFEDALAVTTDPGEAAHLHELAARSAGPVAFAQATGHGRAAAEGYRALGDRDGELRSLAEVARALTSEGRATESIELIEPIAADPTSDRPEAAFALAELARAYMLSARMPEAVAMADRALAAVAGRHEPRVVVEALTSKASALVDRTLEAEALIRGAITIAEREGIVEAELRARNNLASGLVEVRSVTELIAILDGGADTARRLGMAGWLAQFLMFGGGLKFSAGDWAGVELAGGEMGHMTLSPVHEWGMHTLYALPAAYRGDEVTARRALAETDRLQSQFDTAPQLQNSANLDAEVLFALQDYLQALPLAIQAWDYFPAYGDPLLTAVNIAAVLGDGRTLDQLHARRDEPETSAATDAALANLDAARAALGERWDEARLHYLRAIERVDELGWRDRAARIGLEFDAYLGSRFADARAAGERADAFYASVGAESFPARYRAAFQGTPAPPAGGRPAGAAATTRDALPVDAEQPA